MRVRRLYTNEIFKELTVSIHALMRVRRVHFKNNLAYNIVSIHALMRVRLRGVYDTDYQQCNGRFAPTSHGRYKDSRS